MEDKQRISRREFLRLLSLGVGASILAACNPIAESGSGLNQLQGAILYPEGQVLAGSREPKQFSLDQMFTYKKLDKYSEPDYIAQAVQAGQLPPVEQRLPETPQVIL